MSDSFIFAYGPEGRTLNVDASGRIIATQEPYDAFYIYGYGDTGRSLVVDGSGRLGITIDNVDDNTTASNLGTGSGVYSAKVGDDLRFKSITAGDNVSLSGSATEIRISSASGTGGSSDAALRTDFTNASGKWTSDIAENTQGVLDFDNASGVWTADISSNAANISGVDTDFTNASGYWETLIADAGSVDFANASGNMAAAIDLNTAGRIDFTNASGNMVAATTAAQAAADAVQTDFTNASGYWEDLITDAEGEGLDFANASGNIVADIAVNTAGGIDFTNASGIWQKTTTDWDNASGVFESRLDGHDTDIAALQATSGFQSGENITITDSSGFYYGANVELALAELGEREFHKDQGGYVDCYGSGVPIVLTGTVTVSGYVPSGTVGCSEAGYGYVNGLKVDWTAGSGLEVASGTTKYYYVDSAGALQQGNESSTFDEYKDRIDLFRAWYDGENIFGFIHNPDYNFPKSVSWMLRKTVGTILEGTGGNVARVATGTGAAADDRRLKISTAAVINEAGATGVVPADNPLVWNIVYLNAASKWVRQSASGVSELPMQYNNAGTPTALGSNKYGVYRLYAAMPQSPGGDVQFFAVMDDAQYNNSAEALAAIDNGTVSGPTNELEDIKMAQLGYITLYNAGGGYIHGVVINKSTLQTGITAGNQGEAALVSLITTNFNDLLSVTDSNVQIAMDTLDDHTHDVEADFTNASGVWQTAIDANTAGVLDFTNVSGVWESEIDLNTQGVLDFNNSSGIFQDTTDDLDTLETNYANSSGVFQAGVDTAEEVETNYTNSSGVFQRTADDFINSSGIFQATVDDLDTLETNYANSSGVFQAGTTKADTLRIDFDNSSGVLKTLSVQGPLTGPSELNMFSQEVPKVLSILSSGNVPDMTDLTHNEGWVAFQGSCWDGEHIWAAPFYANNILKINPLTGESKQISHSYAAALGAYLGCCFDGRYVWMAPYLASGVLRIDTDDDSTTEYLTNEGTNQFAGAVFDGTYVHLVPFESNNYIRIDPTNPASGNWLKTANTENNQSFTGACFDGKRVWMAPKASANIVGIDPETYTITKVAHGRGVLAYHGCVFDGTYVWFVPGNSDYLTRLNPATQELTHYEHSFKGTNSVWNEGVFDGKHIWMCPRAGTKLVKFDPANAASGNWAYYELNNNNSDYAGLVFTGEDVVLIPYNITGSASVETPFVRVRPQEFGRRSIYTGNIYAISGQFTTGVQVGTGSLHLRPDGGLISPNWSISADGTNTLGISSSSAVSGTVAEYDTGTRTVANDATDQHTVLTPGLGTAIQEGIIGKVTLYDESSLGAGDVTVKIYNDFARTQNVYERVFDLATTPIVDYLPAYFISASGGAMYFDIKNGTGSAGDFSVEARCSTVLSVATAQTAAGSGVTSDSAGDGLSYTQPRLDISLTSDAGLELSGSSPDKTLGVKAGDGISTDSDGVNVDSTVVRTTGAQSITGLKTFEDHAFGINPHPDSGPPTSGTYGAGDMFLDSNKLLYQCTAGGTPGTWQFYGWNYEQNIDLGESAGTDNATYTVAIAAGSSSGITIDTGVPSGADTGRRGVIRKINVWGANVGWASGTLDEPFRIRCYPNENQYGREEIWSIQGQARATELTGTEAGGSDNVIDVNNIDIAAPGDLVRLRRKTATVGEEYARIAVRRTSPTQYDTDEAVINDFTPNDALMIITEAVDLPWLNNSSISTNRHKIYMKIYNDGETEMIFGYQMDIETMGGGPSIS